MCPGPLFVYTTMYHQEKEEVLQYYLILPRKVLFDSFVKKKLRIDYEHFLFSCFEIKTLPCYVITSNNVVNFITLLKNLML